MTIIIGVAGNGANSITDFFPVVPDNFALNHGSILIKNNRILIPLQSVTPNTVPDTIDGLLIIGTPADSVSVQVAHSGDFNRMPGETPETHSDSF